MNALHWDCVVSRHKSFLYQQPAASLNHGSAHFHSSPFVMLGVGRSLESQLTRIVRGLCTLLTVRASLSHCPCQLALWLVSNFPGFQELLISMFDRKKGNTLYKGGC